MNRHRIDRRILLLTGLALLTTSVCADAQIQIAPNRSPVVGPGQMSTSSVGAIYAQQGRDVRLPGAPRVNPNRPPFIQQPIFPGPIIGYPYIGWPYYGYGGFYGGFGGYSNRALAPPPTNVVEPRPFPTAPQIPGRTLVPPTSATPRTPSNKATLTLRVPADAEVWLEGQKMTEQTGTERTFTTPTLKPGQTYEYRVRVRWSEGGETKEQTRNVTLEAGDQKSLLILGGR